MAEFPEPNEAHTQQSTKACPFCAEVIQSAAIKCRFCHSILDARAIAPVQIGLDSKAKADAEAVNSSKQPPSIVQSCPESSSQLPSRKLRSGPAVAWFCIGAIAPMFFLGNVIAHGNGVHAERNLGYFVLVSLMVAVGLSLGSFAIGCLFTLGTNAISKSWFTPLFIVVVGGILYWLLPSIIEDATGGSFIRDPEIVLALAFAIPTLGCLAANSKGGQQDAGIQVGSIKKLDAPIGWSCPRCGLPPVRENWSRSCWVCGAGHVTSKLASGTTSPQTMPTSSKKI